MDLSSCEDFDPYRDLIYLNCSVDNVDQCWKLKDLNTAWDFSTSPMVIIIIVLSVFALFFNLIYSILIHIVWVREKFKGHKRAIFVANRSITTIMSLTIIYTMLILWQTNGFGYVTTSILLVIAACDYMVIANNFFIVTILMFVAILVFRVFYHYSMVVLARTLQIVPGKLHLLAIPVIMLGWGLSALAITMGIIVGLGGSALFFPSESFFSCPVDTCQYPFAVSVLSLICAGYLLMLFGYSTVTVKLRKRVDPLALFSLQVSFGIISIIYVPMIAITIVVMINFDNFSALGDFTVSPCIRLERSNVLLLCCYLVSSAVIFWLIGMVIDPIFNIITEAKFFEHFSTFRRLRSLVVRPKPTSV